MNLIWTVRQNWQKQLSSTCSQSPCRNKLSNTVNVSLLLVLLSFQLVKIMKTHPWSSTDEYQSLFEVGLNVKSLNMSHDNIFPVGLK